MKAKTDIKPRSAYIFVVEPNVLSFNIDQENNWHLQLGAEYLISIKLADQLGNTIYIPDVNFNLLEKTIYTFFLECSF